MPNITINNYGTINICDDSVSKAKDRLLERLYYARNKETMGGYKAWHELLDMYYIGDYVGMQEFIKSCKGKGGYTRHKCIEDLETIINGGI